MTMRIGLLETKVKKAKKITLKIEAALATADPKKQPLQKFMIRKITARIAQLEKP